MRGHTTYSPNLGYTSSSLTANGTGYLVWTIISLVVAVIGGIALYFLFVNKNDKLKDKKLLWLRDFLNFKKLIFEKIIKVTYLILAIFITLYSFNFIGSNFLLFLSNFIIGNILLRIIYEGSILILTICKNTTEINKKLK